MDEVGVRTSVTEDSALIEAHSKTEEEVGASTTSVKRYSIAELKAIGDDCERSCSSAFNHIRSTAEETFQEIKAMVFRRGFQQQSELVGVAEGMACSAGGRQNQHRRGRHRGSRSLPARDGHVVGDNECRTQAALSMGVGFDYADADQCDAIDGGEPASSLAARCSEDRTPSAKDASASVPGPSPHGVAVHDDGDGVVNNATGHGPAREVSMAKKRRQSVPTAADDVIDSMDRDGSDRRQLSFGIDVPGEQASNVRVHDVKDEGCDVGGTSNRERDDGRHGYDEYDDDNEEEEGEKMGSLQARAFAVHGEPNFEAGPPLDGAEYLRRVRWEASRCPGVKTVRVDPKKLKASQTAYMPKIPDVPVCPQHLCPSKEWQSAFLADFSSLRQSLQNLERPQPGRPGLRLPKAKDEAGWKAFCLGRCQSAANAATSELTMTRGTSSGDESAGTGATGTSSIGEVAGQETSSMGESAGAGTSLRGESVRQRTDSGVCYDGQQMPAECAGQDRSSSSIKEEVSDGADATSTATSSATTDRICSGGRKEGDDNNSAQSALQPTLDVMVKLDDVTTASLLCRQIDWLENAANISEHRFAWLFALLAQVGKPLDADTTAAIRSLLRCCCRLRSTKQSVDDPEMPRLNILIAIAGKYFGQAEGGL
ncbi:hypothetical protein CBR_g48670 [Chara braunii]|uniref:Gem-associated protein 2 n=1 Tax=Chara braunii TaxID=69332 RepID=A0A388K4D7_CHABU|nr:hypothetical protein CBR_g48670 [Chara braunii]|eukprot:GBG64922.1 hypothetical protein CBR_g48670 [Chara braunii]